MHRRAAGQGRFLPMLPRRVAPHEQPADGWRHRVRVLLVRCGLLLVAAGGAHVSGLRRVLRLLVAHRGGARGVQLGPRQIELAVHVPEGLERERSDGARLFVPEHVGSVWYDPVKPLPPPRLRHNHHVVAPHPLVELARARLAAPYPHVGGVAVLLNCDFVDARRRRRRHCGEVEAGPQVVRRPVELGLRMCVPAALRRQLHAEVHVEEELDGRAADAVDEVFPHFDVHVRVAQRAEARDDAVRHVLRRRRGQERGCCPPHPHGSSRAASRGGCHSGSTPRKPVTRVTLDRNQGIEVFVHFSAERRRAGHCSLLIADAQSLETGFFHKAVLVMLLRQGRTDRQPFPPRASPGQPSRRAHASKQTNK